MSKNGVNDTETLIFFFTLNPYIKTTLAHDSWVQVSLNHEINGVEKFPETANKTVELDSAEFVCTFECLAKSKPLKLLQHSNSGSRRVRIVQKGGRNLATLSL